LRLATREERVFLFMEAGDTPVFTPDNINPDQTNMIFNCIIEEFNEFVEAAADYELNSNSPEARANLCKEWADLQYVLSQAAVYYGVPGDEAFTRVADNNMTTVVDGKLVKREDGKILKPEGYTPANMEGL